MRTGRSIAPPVKRSWLDKDGCGKRPIGEPAFEDKIAQRQRRLGKWEWYIRFSRVYPLWGQVTPGILGDKAQDEKEESQTVFEILVDVAQTQSPSAAEGTTRHAKHQAAWSLSVLRHYW
jgi:hypothetical protein